VVVLTAPVVRTPLIGSAPVQPSEPAHDVALLEVHVSVDVPPGETTEGYKVNIAVGTILTTAVAGELPPPGPVQVSEYEVAVFNAAVFWVPLMPTEPLHPPDAVHAVALLEVHVNAAVLPAATAVGSADRVTVGNGMSVTAAVAGALVPPGPVHMSAYPVFAITGPVLWVPLAASVPLHPPEAVQEVALVEFQVRTEALPEATAVGAAESVAVGAAIRATVAVAGAETPPGPAQTIEYT
jgi:hypothetical protein